MRTTNILDTTSFPTSSTTESTITPRSSASTDRSANNLSSASNYMETKSFPGFFPTKSKIRGTNFSRRINTNRNVFVKFLQ